MSLLIELARGEDETRNLTLMNKMLLDCLKNVKDLEVLQEKNNKEHIQVQYKGCDRGVSLLEKEADRVGLMLYNRNNRLEKFTLLNRKDFFCKDGTVLFSPSQASYLLYSVLIQKYISSDLIVAVFPPHAEKHEELYRTAIYAFPGDSSWIDRVNDHFGSEVALYIAFMNHFIVWLFPPAAIGLIIAVLNTMISDRDINRSLFMPLFSIFIIIWSILFVQYLKRTCSHLTCKWGVLAWGQTENISKERTEFHGKWEISKVTGKKIKRFAWHRRVPYYLYSALVTSGMLLISFFVMVVSLNFQGYIDEHALGYKFLHFPSISKYSERGAIFDNSGDGPYPAYFSYVPVIVHVLVIRTLNSWYRDVAEYLTRLENHRTHQHHINSLIIKRVLFEAFDCYIALFYLAFCQLNIVALRSELFGLYTVDSIRRVTFETILPYVSHNAFIIRSNWNKSKHKAKKGSPETSFAPNEMTPDVSEQFILENYDSFDDYLEMIIAFGYITLFASAFPMASGLTLICVILEIKSDIFKIFWVSRKPLPRYVRDIGTWSDILTCIAWLSIITNVFLFAFTTEQMMQFFPALFTLQDSHITEHFLGILGTGSEYHKHIMKTGKQSVVWGLCFCIEHALLVLAFWVSKLVPCRPEWVDEELERQENMQRKAVNSQNSQDKKFD